MSRFRPVLTLLLACGILAVIPSAFRARAAEPVSALNFVPATEIGADAFRAANPAHDGRGVVIAILDTGIDAFSPGLQLTTTGQAKLIDVQDLSTEGHWDTEVAERSEDGGVLVFQAAGGLVLRGAADLPVPPADDPARPVHVGVISEGDFLNSPGVHDLNDDGDTSDRFGFLVWAAERAAVEEALGIGAGYEFLQGLNETAAATVAKERQSSHVWLVVVDTDGNGDLADESLLRDFRVNHDSFAMAADNAPESRALMAWQVNVAANEDHLGTPLPPTVEFHFDDGSHGSHCAGIAAGHNVGGIAGLDGAAPGAWLMSLKLGDNRLSGGATRTESMKRAYDYAAEFEAKWGIPVVINMSFGINSVQEGDSAMEGWINGLLAEHPTLYVCTSAGNEGPGLSTTGLPATSYSVIASGASLAPATAADLYDARIERTTLFNFSSRGGEANKPDIVAPGSALSTVPGFNDGSGRFNGTSMASPQTAGGVACLVGAAQNAGLDIHWGMVKRAVIAGARRVEGLNLNDQGGGLVDVPSSWDLLQELAGSESAHEVLWYEIQTDGPFQGDGRAEAAYWRTPGGIPFAPEKVLFSVRPVFHPDLDADARDAFVRAFSFKSEADWLNIVSGERYIRGERAMSVVCTYDGDKLSEPGRYAARIHGSLAGGDLGGLAAREFSLWNTVVVGAIFGPDVGYSRSWDGRGLAQSAVDRYYVDVPPGSSAMRVRLEVSGDTGASDGAGVLTEICDPEGTTRGGFAGYARRTGNQIKDMTVLAPELYPGTWEINVASSIMNLDTSDYRLTVSFDGYAVDASGLGEIKAATAGETAKGSLEVTRVFPGVFRGSVDAAVRGYAREKEIEIAETDTWEHAFSLDGDTPEAEFTLLMTKDVGNLFTDCAINILDGSGRSVVSSAFNGLEGHVSVRLPRGQDNASYTLQVVGAFALAQDMADWGFDLTEAYHFAAPVSGAVKRSGGGALRLPAGVPTGLAVSFAGDWPAVPDGMKVFGDVSFSDIRTTDRRPGDEGGRLVLAVPFGP